MYTFRKNSKKPLGTYHSTVTHGGLGKVYLKEMANFISFKDTYRYREVVNASCKRLLVHENILHMFILHVYLQWRSEWGGRGGMPPP